MVAHPEFALPLRATVESAFPIIQNPSDLRSLLPEVYKNIEVQARNPLTFKITYADGLPVKTETRKIISNNEGTYIYHITAGDAYDRYNRLIQVTQALAPFNGRVYNTSIRQTYDTEIGPDFLGFDVTNVIKLDNRLNV